MDLSFEPSGQEDAEDVNGSPEVGPLRRAGDPLLVLRSGFAQAALQRLYRDNSGVLAWSMPPLRALVRRPAPTVLPAGHGALLYQLMRLLDARLILAAGTSHGIAAIWLPCALRENGRHRGDRCVIGLEPATAEAEEARASLRAAAVSRYVDIREGTPLDQIARIDAVVDLLYIDRHACTDVSAVLALIRCMLPRLRSGSAIVIDRIHHRPEAAARLRDPANGFAAATLPYPAGVELLVKV